MTLFASLLCFAATTFAESKALLAQIALDRAGFSCNTIDGVWGAKSARAFHHYAAKHLAKTDAAIPTEPDEIYDTFFKEESSPFCWVQVTQNDLDSLVQIPDAPADRARLERMNYESIAEMFAERGHLSPRALERLNPTIDWSHVTVGTKIRIPQFPSQSEELSVWPKDRAHAPQRPEATLVRISLSRYELTAYDEKGALLAAFPCSIAKNQAKLPPHGEFKVTTSIAHPNYTLTHRPVSAGQPVRTYILPPGPNCPVGVVWIGLSLPSYGIHGTPRPETVGSAESRGCFRLANWNAARLYGLVRPGVRVIIEE